MLLQLFYNSEYKYLDGPFQLKRTLDELQSTVEQKEEMAQRCHELDLQVMLPARKILELHDMVRVYTCSLLMPMFI